MCGAFTYKMTNVAGLGFELLSPNGPLLPGSSSFILQMYEHEPEKATSSFTVRCITLCDKCWISGQ